MNTRQSRRLEVFAKWIEPLPSLRQYVSKMDDTEAEAWWKYYDTATYRRYWWPFRDPTGSVVNMADTLVAITPDYDGVMHGIGDIAGLAVVCFGSAADLDDLAGSPPTAQWDAIDAYAAEALDFDQYGTAWMGLRRCRGVRDLKSVTGQQVATVLRACAKGESVTAWWRRIGRQIERRIEKMIERQKAGKNEPHVGDGTAS